MIDLYVLRSLTHGARYTGIAKDKFARLEEHNSGKNRYTKGHRPWEIVYYETHANWEEARKREKYLKSASGRKWLDRHLSKG